MTNYDERPNHRAVVSGCWIDGLAVIVQELFQLDPFSLSHFIGSVQVPDAYFAWLREQKETVDLNQQPVKQSLIR
ncbi:transposase [Planococcus sp. CPCC 101016]|uniref:transposase n=1 Tax=Planococcus sp. CPCC 101016 TaxID=2599617 RepID=UPI0011B7103F|nr:transposase [Planococcus sp. CPCC 101016]TWT07045.1 transposase [Planococcus sp. CPCC 101016]